jgi:hypothetical protein
MTTKQQIIGCQQKLNSKQAGDIADIIRIVTYLQKQEPNALLCGSVALYFADLLPYRNFGDIDFVINRKHFNTEDLPYRKDKYAGINRKRDKYESYHLDYYRMGKDVSINFLVHDDDVQLNEQTIKTIKCQSVDDILHWKRKYNRPKDKQDLKKIQIQIDSIFESTVLNQEEE